MAEHLGSARRGERRFPTDSGGGPTFGAERRIFASEGVSASPAGPGSPPPRANVPLPDEVTLSLAAVQDLFGTVEQALRVIEADHGRRSTTYPALDDALGRASRELIDRLGLFGEEG